jgi:hypothetical protein
VALEDSLTLGYYRSPRWGFNLEPREPSSLRYAAPSLVSYQPQLVRVIDSRSRQFDYKENRIYFFRVTRLGESGPHYGKIYGDFMQFRYYLNPVPGSSNVEFDPKQDLFKKLSWREEVDEP